jgi:tetratricopeptide (TPR) repeat protein
MNNLADLLINEGKNPEAEKLNREVLQVRERVLGPDHPDTIVSMANLGRVLVNDGHAREAEDLYIRVVEKRRSVLGPEHPDTVKAMADLGDALLRQKKYSQAEKVIREALGIGKRVLAAKGPLMACMLYNLAALAGVAGRSDEAIGLLNQSIDTGLPPAAVDGMGQDPDLQPLHADPRFAVLVAHAKKIAGR